MIFKQVSTCLYKKMKPKTKKILIISYYWPPAGGPGVQRWLKFIKYLPNFGWEPTVFIPEMKKNNFLFKNLRELTNTLKIKNL